MGLIKAAGKAVSTTLKDQWKEFIKCENMDNNTLMIKKTTENGVITKKSAIEVAPGQIAVIFQSGIKSRCILEDEKVNSKCAICGEDAKHLVVWGIQY